MNPATNNYIISGGQEGKSRLNILSDVLYASTKALLESNGLAQGTAFLDIGCGGGNVSLMAGEIVGAPGRVTAIDFDEEIIALAQKDVQERSIPNVSFSAGSAYDIAYSEKYDMAYARF